MAKKTHTKQGKEDASPLPPSMCVLVLSRSGSCFMLTTLITLTTLTMLIALITLISLTTLTTLTTLTI